MAQQLTEPDAMPNPFAVDPDDELPVGLQLTLRLRALIATGQLAAGEKLPSVRRLAEWAGVNLNTIRAVYSHLEKEGLVVSRQGQGTFVAAGVRAAPRLEEIATEAIRQARAAGLSARDLAEVALVCASIPGEAPFAPARDDLGLDPAEAEVIEVRHELRRQIGRLEAELADYALDLPTDMPTAPRVTVGHIAGVEELEQTRDTLVAQLSEARRAAERRIRAEARERAGKDRSAEGREKGGVLAGAMGWWRDKR
jgi:DNA-binding transcriptional regulator YhcF (GntR family)